jgi:hypothetical protein
LVAATSTITGIKLKKVAEELRARINVVGEHEMKQNRRRLIKDTYSEDVDDPFEEAGGVAPPLRRVEADHLGVQPHCLPPPLHASLGSLYVVSSPLSSFSSFFLSDEGEEEGEEKGSKGGGDWREREEGGRQQAAKERYGGERDGAASERAFSQGVTPAVSVADEICHKGSLSYRD